MALQEQAEPFTDTPNSALRLILGLNHGVYLVAFSSKDGYGSVTFKSAKEVADFLRNIRDAKYSYLAASDHFWKNVEADSICLFHKDKCIVGEAQMKGKIKLYAGPETSPVTKRQYAGEVDFLPNTIKLYKRPIPFAEAEAALRKKLAWMGMQKLSVGDYKKISSIAEKDGYE